MGIASCVELWDQRQGTIDFKAQRKYTRVFLVYTTGNNFAAATVFGASCIPTIGTAYSTGSEVDTGAVAKSISARQDAADPLRWIVQVEYDTTLEVPDGQTPPINENPLLRPAVWKGSFNRSQKAVQEDLDGNALVNSAGQPFDPPVSQDTYLAAFSVSVNKATIDFDVLWSLIGCVNDADWNPGTLFLAHTVLVAGITFSSQYDKTAGGSYWTVEYSFEFNSDGWLPTHILDAGYYERNNDGTVKQIMDSYGHPLSSLSLLDGMGKRQDDPTSPIYLPYNLYPTADFSIIP